MTRTEIIIPKKDLISGKYYLGRTSQRGMPIGIWDNRDQVFICLKAEMMGWVPFRMPHIEDESQPDRWVSFEPIAMIETPDF